MTEGNWTKYDESCEVEAPTCWEEAAYDATKEILRKARNHVGVVGDESLADWVDHDVTCIRRNMQDAPDEDLRPFFVSIGVGAVVSASTHEDLRAEFAWDVYALACSKQHDYGHDNINTEGLTGLRVRLSDKIARFKNLLGRGDEAKNESLADTKVDFLGYAIVSMMFIDGTFQLPLRSDQVVADAATEAFFDEVKLVDDDEAYGEAALIAEWEFSAIPEDKGLDEAISASHDSRDVRDVWSHRDIEEIVHDMVNGMFISFSNEDRQTIREIAQEEIGKYVPFFVETSLDYHVPRYVREAIDVHEEYHHPTPKPWPGLRVEQCNQSDLHNLAIALGMTP